MDKDIGRYSKFKDKFSYHIIYIQMKMRYNVFLSFRTKHGNNASNKQMLIVSVKDREDFSE